MPYVQRNTDGQISAVSDSATADCCEEVPAGSPELTQFFDRYRPQGELADTDLAFVRVLEDLLDVLIDKNVLLFTELPVEAQEKVLRRQSLRQHGNALDLLQDES